MSWQRVSNSYISPSSFSHPIDHPITYFSNKPSAWQTIRHIHKRSYYPGASWDTRARYFLWGPRGLNEKELREAPKSLIQYVIQLLHQNEYSSALKYWDRLNTITSHNLLPFPSIQAKEEIPVLEQESEFKELYEKTVTAIDMTYDGVLISSILEEKEGPEIRIDGLRQTCEEQDLQAASESFSKTGFELYRRGQTDKALPLLKAAWDLKKDAPDQTTIILGYQLSLCYLIDSSIPSEYTFHFLNKLVNTAEQIKVHDCILAVIKSLQGAHVLIEAIGHQDVEQERFNIFLATAKQLYQEAARLDPFEKTYSTSIAAIECLEFGVEFENVREKIYYYVDCKYGPINLLQTLIECISCDSNECVTYTPPPQPTIMGKGVPLILIPAHAQEETLNGRVLRKLSQIKLNLV